MAFAKPLASCGEDIPKNAFAVSVDKNIGKAVP